MAAFFCPQTGELSGQHWYGISYLRLSKLGKRYESESIDNQRKLIHEFVQRHPEITLVGEQVDDGYTAAKARPVIVGAGVTVVYLLTNQRDLRVVLYELADQLALVVDTLALIALAQL